MKEKMKYCDKHKFEYTSNLSECPVCVGEAFNGDHNHGNIIEKKRIKKEWKRN